MTCGVSSFSSLGQDGDWVVGPTRYPHSCDIRALALLPAAAPDVSSAAGSGRTSRQPHALTFSGDGASLVAVTGAVDGSICFNERLMGLAVGSSLGSSLQVLRTASVSFLLEQVE